MGEPIPQPDDVFDNLLSRAEELTHRFETHPNAAVREDAFELLQTIDAIHRSAILKLVQLVLQSGNHELIHRAAEDPQVSAILQLYDVLSLPMLVRWQEFLDNIRPLLTEHGADVELMRVADEMPVLRLAGAFGRDETDLREMVQQAIAAAFGSYQSVRWEARRLPAAPSRLIPLSSIARAKKQVWTALTDAPEVAIGSLHKLQVNEIEVVLARSQHGFHVYPNACPGSALPLHMGRISENVIVCPWHGCQFDLRTGKRENGAGLDLKPLTIRVESGQVQLGLWE